MGLSSGASVVYVARWALGTPSHAQEFAPQSWLSWRLIGTMPDALVHLVFLFPPLAAVVAWLLLPFLSAEEITDGNVNFSYRVMGRAGRTLFIKQAPDFVKWQPQMALESERMAREVRYFEIVREELGESVARRFLPAIHHFDETRCIFIMQFLETSSLLFNQLFEPNAVVAPEVSAALGEYLGRVHGATLGRKGRAGRGYDRAAEFWNPALRKIQLEHVYTVRLPQRDLPWRDPRDPHAACSPRPLCTMLKLGVSAPPTAWSVAAHHAPAPREGLLRALC